MSTLPVSYRPISLLPYLSKLSEKIIKSRIDEHINNNKIITEEQFGFRNNHSTVDQLARMVNNITANFNDKKHTGAIFLDLAKAFDNVWHSGLIYKMIKLNFPVNLIFLVNSYLSKREFVVVINGVKSISHSIYTGVPQGTVLGPLLFLIYTNDAPVTKLVHSSIFADDKGLYTNSFRVDTIKNRLEKATKSNIKFFRKWKISLNSDKTESIFFSKRRPVIDQNVRVNENIIEWSKNVKHLGLILDRKLNFNSHIDMVIQRATIMLITLYPLLNKKSKLSTINKLNIYKSIVRPIMTYACPVWNLISKYNMNRLQVMQNKFSDISFSFLLVRIVLGKLILI